MNIRTRPAATRHRRRDVGEWARRLILVAIAVPWVGVPLWMLLVNSAKPYTEASQLGLGLPKRWNLVQNYGRVIEQGNYPSALTNSLLIAIPTLACVIIFGSMAAWAFARARGISMKVAYNLSVLSVLLPPAILPTIFELQVLGIDGSRLGYFLVLVGTRLGVVVFLATGFIRTMPPDLEEAAAIDGASKAQIYRLLILPALLPILLVGGVILIITIWNEFLFALFLLRGPAAATLPLALYRFSSTSSEFTAMRWELIFAHVVLTSLPLIMVYLFVQKRLVSGLSEGAIKG